MLQIQPEEFDLIVVGSGLPECLIAGAAAKAGETVLIIEPEDSYGSEFSSCTLETLEKLLLSGGARHPARHQLDDLQLEGNVAGVAHSSTSGGCAAAGSDDDGRQPPQQQHAPAGSTPCSGGGSGTRVVPLSLFQLPVEGLQCWSRPGADLGNQRAYILDLAPKALYQAESLVDILVKTRAHNYVEFKLVEGSYIWRDGRLQLVPASKSDIFKDRSLSLSDKRVLMKFISGAADAVEGKGHLKDVLSGDRPLFAVLSEEGLTPALQDVVLYGIAMCDHKQTPSTSTPPQYVTPTTPHPAEAGASGATDASGVAGDTHERSTAGGSAAAHGDTPATGISDDAGRMSAARGCGALKLLMESLGRFGSPGAFMATSFGCGSIPEAFVRFAAVQGAVTVLRQSVTGLLVDEHPGQRRPLDQAPQQQDDASASSNSGGDGGDGNSNSGGSATPPGLCRGVVTSSGQVLKCSRLLASSNVLRPLLDDASGRPPISTSRHPATILSRAVVLLDDPLVAGTQTTCLVLPPGAVGNEHAVRGLQMGSALNVAPPQRYVLYLSTPSSGGSAWEELQPAVSALADNAGVHRSSPSSLPSAPPPDTAADASDTSDSAACATDVSGQPGSGATLTSAADTAAPATLKSAQPAADDVPPASVPPAGVPPATASSGDATVPPAAPSSIKAGSKPRVLRAFYYQQRVAAAADASAITGTAQSLASSAAAVSPDASAVAEGAQLTSISTNVPTGPARTSLPPNVICTSIVDGSMLGYEAVLSGAAAVFAEHWRGKTWLSDLEPSTAAARDESDEDEAVEALQAALDSLARETVAGVKEGQQT